MRASRHHPGHSPHFRDSRACSLYPQYPQLAAKRHHATGLSAGVHTPAGRASRCPTATCHLGGMPRTMASRFLEFIITQDTTYILAGIDILDNRRIYTDG